ncbi:MAG: inositol-3-phosphate synthase [Planctomycetota bacterium]
MTVDDNAGESGTADEAPRRTLGVWFVGARGAIATTVAYGLEAVASGLRGPIGLVSELPEFAGLGLASLDSIVVGGWEVRPGTIARAAADLAANGVLPQDVVAKSAAVGVDARTAPGIARKDDPSASPASRERGELPLREQVRVLGEDLAAFAGSTGVDTVVVVNVASTEAVVATPECASDLAALERALDADEKLPQSVIYAYAALRAGCPHVNFTPSPGASWPALRELAREMSLPHCGDDGKTGETLVKTTLAPMFAHRALKVRAWQGYNMLGNRDGETLSDPANKGAKLRTKDAALRSILGDPKDLHTHVGIDFVPSLHDWKTAWDFVHFEGFLGARMSLQFTWSGSDSALAAPLVIDLVRFTELAKRRGESGELAHLASFFKSPLSGGSHDFHVQFAALVDYARRATTGS